MRIRSWLFLVLGLMVFCDLKAQSQIKPDSLIQDLGCSACHSGLDNPTNIKEKAPDLSTAGLLYQPAYLFDYLQNPKQVRKNIGLSRMPDFYFSEKEALAVVKFLQAQKFRDKKWPAFPVEIDNPSRSVRTAFTAEPEALIRQMGCLKCHTLKGEGKGTSFDLTLVGQRINPEQIRKYLTAPYIFGVPKKVMPALFYHLNVQTNQFEEVEQYAAAKILIIADYLSSFGRKRRNQQSKKFARALQDNPEVDASLGKLILRSQNCMACHKIKGIRSWKQKTAPDLSFEGQRVKEEWLQTYLKKPEAIRPFGFYPGSGSRMPDFGLAEAELETLSRYLLQQKSAGKKAQFQPEKLSRFAMNKAQKLLQDKLSCLGCHRLGKKGGRIGPDLSTLKLRLQPEFVNQIIRKPQKVVPNRIMPEIPMAPKYQKLIVNYLLQQDIPKTPEPYLSLVENPIIFPIGEGKAEQLYNTYCAICHGVAGQGNGYNATYLPKTPTRHADSAYMSNRPDDTLFDGIYAGGYILNKSQMMPPWGRTLSVDEIKMLVGYMRKLCGCEGPLWSRDNR